MPTCATTAPCASSRYKTKTAARRLRWCGGRFTRKRIPPSQRRLRSIARATCAKHCELSPPIAGRRKTSSSRTVAAPSPITSRAWSRTIRPGADTFTQPQTCARPLRRFRSPGFRAGRPRTTRFSSRPTTNPMGRRIPIASPRGSRRPIAPIASRSCCVRARATTKHILRACSSTRSHRSTPKSRATSSASHARTPTGG